MKTQENYDMPIRSFNYGRNSDPKQNKGRSRKRQTEGFAEFSERKGWIPDDTYTFYDAGKSGYHGEHLGPNGELTRFLSLLERGTIPRGSVLVLEHLDRLGRMPTDEAYDVFRKILSLGCMIATIEPERVYKYGDSNPLSILEPVFIMSANYEKSLMLSKRISDIRQEEKEEARNGQKRKGKLPCWVELVDGEYRVIPGRKAAIREAMRLVVELGLGTPKVAMRLNADPVSFPAPGHTTWKDEERAPEWRGTSILQLLKKRQLIGEYQPMIGRKSAKVPDGAPIQNYYPAVMTEEEFDVLQAALSSHSAKKGGSAPGRRGDVESNLFTGLVWEGRSRLPMSLRTMKTAGRPRPPRLSPSADGFRGSAGYSAPYPQFEAGILRSLGALSLADVLPADEARSQLERQIQEQTARLVSVQHRCEQLQALLSDPDCAIGITELAEALKSNKQEEALLRQSLERAKLKSRTSKGEQLGQVQSLLSLLQTARNTDQEGEVIRRLKSALKWLVDEIWIVLEPIGKRGRNPLYAIHCQVYLRAGRRFYVQLLPSDPPAPLSLWQLGECDFRAGDIGD